jgi:hypothetical protein
MSGATGGQPSRRKLLLRFAVLLGAPPAVLTTEPRTPSEPFWGPMLGRAASLFGPIATAVTVGFVLTYLVLWDVSSRSAFSPQALTVSSAAARLDAGAAPDSVLPAYRIDVAQSAYLFVAVYDVSGQPLASSGLLDGRPPDLPTSVFAYARTGVDEHDDTWDPIYAGAQDWVLWSPRRGVTSAIVIQPWASGFVVAGRSAGGPAGELAVAWALTLVATAMACLFVGLVLPLHTQPPPPWRGDGGDDPEPGPIAPPGPRHRRSHGFRPAPPRRRPTRPRRFSRR